MKKDILISILVFFVIVLFVFIFSRPFFVAFATSQKVLGGFIKFFFLASIGDFIGLRIKSKKWKIPTYMFFKAIVWGFIGIVIVLMFVIFPSGVTSLQNNNILPFKDSLFFFAFFTSVLMNVTFAPTMMLFHRISDTYLELKKENKQANIGDAIEAISFKQFFSFTIFKTIPFFWIPAHTITFLLPTEYQIIFAAILGIVLGVLLGIFKNKKK